MEGTQNLTGMRLQMNFLSLGIDMIFPQTTTKLIRRSPFVLEDSPGFVLLDTLSEVF